jgi:pentose-5-phosphate-3-epimerase
MKEESPHFLNLQLEAANEKNSCDRLTELATQNTTLARIVAQNPSATPELLRQLSTARDIKTRLYVTANPHTPRDVLLKLGRSFPEQLLRNPVFSFLLLENPSLLSDLLDEMPLNTLQDILKFEGLPAYVLQKFARHHDVWVRAAIAFNPNTPVTLLEELAIDRDVVRQSAAHNLNTPRSILEKLAKDISWLVRQAVAANPSTPHNTLEELSWDNQWHIRVAIASNPNTPTRILETFRWDNDWGMRQALAQNPNTPVRILEQLALDKDFEIRRDVAKNPSTPLSAIEELIRNQDFTVCFYRRQPNF